MFNKTFKAIIYLLALFSADNIKSQRTPTGSWQIVNTEIVLNNKWSVFGEGQLRSQKIFSDFFFHELNSSLNFKPNKDISILLGMGQTGTYSNGGNFKNPVLNHEFRLWEQVAFLNNIGRIRIEHRYRIEQRWRTNGYRNRFRLRLNTIFPINKPSIEKGTLYATFYDEIFLSDKLPYYELNRVLCGLGYQFSRPVRLVIAWIRQASYSVNNITSRKDFLQTTVSFRLNPHLSHQHHHNVILN